MIPSITAIEVSMNPKYSQGETLLAKFSGNFIDQINEENVFFYINNTAIPMIFDVVKINDDFYVYALLASDQEPGNYSIRIKGIRYYKATQIVSDEIISNFTVLGERAAFSVNPGVLITNSDFSVELENLKDSAITIKINNPESITSESSILLNTGQKKLVSFTLDNSASRGLTNIDFSSGNTSYKMPVYLDTNISEPKEEQNQELKMEFQPKTANISLTTNSSSKKILYLKNTGTSTLEDISFNISSQLEKYISLSPKKINSLEPGKLKQIEIEISSGSEEVSIEGKIIAYTKNISTSFTLTLNLIKDFIPSETKVEKNPAIVSLCEDLGGVICADNLECSGDIVRSKNGDCCIAPFVCQEPKKSSSGKIIGWGILVLVFIFIIWFFKIRYKRVHRVKPF